MKRAFSQISSRLLKKNENEELRATIQFLTRGSDSSSPISSLLRTNKGGVGSTNKGEAKEEDNKHVERILKILNSTLPEVDLKKRRVEAHYEILFNQLKNIVEKSIENSEHANSPATISESSEVLYNRLMMLQYTNQLKSAKQMAKIVLSKGFSEFDRVWRNISIFDDEQKWNLTILLYYRTRNEKIREQYMHKWFEKYHELHIIIQRIFWRCIIKETEAKKKQAQVLECIGRITNWNNNDLIVLYQSLYMVANMLPVGLPHIASHLSRNQELFINSLRVLSAGGHEVKDLSKWLIKIVKLSVENKLAMEQKSISQSSKNPTISIYQYRFIRGLDLALQEIYSCSEENTSATQLRNDLEAILRIANEEEQEVKSQMSLKFI